MNYKTYVLRQLAPRTPQPLTTTGSPLVLYILQIVIDTCPTQIHNNMVYDSKTITVCCFDVSSI